MDNDTRILKDFLDKFTNDAIANALSYDSNYNEKFEKMMMDNSIKYDVNTSGIPKCTLTREEIENIGKETVIDWRLEVFEEDTISVADKENLRMYNEVGYGLYGFFAIETQHFYSTKEDLYYILGMARYCKDHSDKIACDFYYQNDKKCMDKAIQDTNAHLTKIWCDVIGIDNVVVINNIEDLMNDSKSFILQNYDYDYKIRYRYKLHYYEYLMGIDD